MDTIITSSNPHPLSSWQAISAFLGFLAIFAAVSGGWEAFIRGARKSLPKKAAPPPLASSSSEDWDALCARTNQIIGKIISELPPDIAREAEQVPCLFRERAEKELTGYITMGTYHNFTPGVKSNHNGPIFLFLKSIEAYCLNENLDFEEKVSFTYLHELGHHFGWDEIDLARHGLPSARLDG